MVDIAADCAHHRGDGAQSLQGVEAADVAGVPNFVAMSEVDGKSVVPGGVGVGENAYLLHLAGIMPRGTALRLTVMLRVLARKKASDT